MGRESRKEAAGVGKRVLIHSALPTRFISLRSRSQPFLVCELLLKEMPSSSVLARIRCFFQAANNILETFGVKAQITVPLHCHGLVDEENGTKSFIF